MNFNPRPHREIEKKYGCKRNSLEHAVKYILNNKLDLQGIVKGCAEYCETYGNRFDASFNLYVSCLEHPKKVKEVISE